MNNEKDYEYDGKPFPLSAAYKNLKNTLRAPAAVYNGVAEKPHYMKMTFSMCRNAVNGERFLEISKVINLKLIILWYSYKVFRKKKSHLLNSRVCLVAYHKSNIVTCKNLYHL